MPLSAADGVPVLSTIADRLVNDLNSSNALRQSPRMCSTIAPKDRSSTTSRSRANRIANESPSPQGPSPTEVCSDLLDAHAVRFSLLEVNLLSVRAEDRPPLRPIDDAQQCEAALRRRVLLWAANS